MQFTHFIMAALALGAANALANSGHAQQTAAKTAKPLNVAFVVYNDMEALDLSGPLDVFVKAERTVPHSYNIYTVGINATPIHSEGNALNIQPRYSIANCPQPDILVVPGAPTQGFQALNANASFIQWIQKVAGHSQQVMSVCTGAFVLGKAGLLDGRKSTTHWFTLDDFHHQFPKTTVMQGVRFVEDGKFLTTAGVSSGIDGALHIVAKNQGQAVADGIARVIQYRPNAPIYPAQTPGKFVPSSKPVSKTGAHKLDSHVDPVCGMKVTDDAKFTSEYHGHWYGFCSDNCEKAFVAHPAQYVK